MTDKNDKTNEGAKPTEAEAKAAAEAEAAELEAKAAAEAEAEAAELEALAKAEAKAERERILALSTTHTKVFVLGARGVNLKGYDHAANLAETVAEAARLGLVAVTEPKLDKGNHLSADGKSLTLSYSVKVVDPAKTAPATS